MWGRRLTRESRNLNGVERMNLVRSTFLVLAATALVACERSGDNNDIVDGGIDGGLERRWFLAGHLRNQRRGDPAMFPVASVRHDRTQTADFSGMSDRELLSDHAAHRDTHYMARTDVQRVEQARSIVGHVRHGVANILERTPGDERAHHFGL